MCAKRTIDDTNLWAEVAKTITPANREDVLPRQTTSKTPKAKAGRKTKSKTQPQASQIATKQAPSPQNNPADLRSKAPVMRAGIDNASARRLTKGHFEIDDTIDLHGKTEAMAHKALLQFIQSANRRGARTLLIITGKGAAGMGVLRRKVPEWLKEYPLKPLILAISQASPRDGGGGALYVRLRRARDLDSRDRR